MKSGAWADGEYYIESATEYQYSQPPKGSIGGQAYIPYGSQSKRVAAINLEKAVALKTGAQIKTYDAEVIALLGVEL